MLEGIYLHPLLLFLRVQDTLGSKGNIDLGYLRINC